MKLKPAAVRAILSLVAASLLVTGCTTSTTSNTNQTASSSHDATLSQLVNSQSAYFNNSSPQGTAYPEFQLTWLNDTAVRVAITGINSTNQTQKISELFLAFTEHQREHTAKC
jgi:outer membrane biogenesis lipoprotein LolB